MTTTKVEITYGNDTVVMEWDGAQASAPILVDGEPTPYRTADARHYTEHAVRLVAAFIWGPVYETSEAAEADERSPGVDEICIWGDLAYAEIDDERNRRQGA